MTILKTVEEIVIGDIIRLDYFGSHWYIVECFENKETHPFLGTQRRCQVVYSSDLTFNRGECVVIHKGWFNPEVITFTLLNR